MSISDLFDSGFKKRNESHFASIVRVAMADGVITDDPVSARRWSEVKKAA